MTKLVRLKPLDAKRGHVIQRYNVFSTTFDVSKGWYRVSEEMAAYLSTIHQVADDEESPFAFDIFSEDEAKQFEAAEKLKKQKAEEERARAIEVKVVASAEKPHDISGLGADLTTADLHAPARRSRRTANEGRTRE